MTVAGIFICIKDGVFIDQACGTGGMLSTAYSYIKHMNPSADIRLFGQEYILLRKNSALFAA